MSGSIPSPSGKASFSDDLPVSKMWRGLRHLTSNGGANSGGASDDGASPNDDGANPSDGGANPSDGGGANPNGGDAIHDVVPTSDHASGLLPASGVPPRRR
jgi:hypothetical protein